MVKKKVLHTIYSGLGGHGSVLIPLLTGGFSENFVNHVVFYGVEDLNPNYSVQMSELGIPYTFIQKKNKEFFKPFRKFKQVLTSFNPECIIVHNSELIIPACKWMRKRSGKTIYVEHENNQSKSRILRYLTKFALKKANHVVCLTPLYQLELNKIYGENKKISVLSNGVNTCKFSPKDKEANSQITIGMAGRFVPVKDQKNLILAFKNLINEYPKLQLHFAGEGELMEPCKNLVAQLGLEKYVTFLGLLDENEMIRFYQSIDLYVHATKAENMSTAILQAMASEKVVLTSDIENNKLLIQEGMTGYFYNNENVLSLTQKIKFLLQQKDEWNTIGRNARSYVKENFSTEKMVKDYKELIDSLD